MGVPQISTAPILPEEVDLSPQERLAAALGRLSRMSQQRGYESLFRTATQMAQISPETITVKVKFDLALSVDVRDHQSLEKRLNVKDVKEVRYVTVHRSTFLVAEEDDGGECFCKSEALAQRGGREGYAISLAMNAFPGLSISSVREIVISCGRCDQ